MDRKRLGYLYSYSTQEIQKLTTLLYESLHTDVGDPSTDWETTLDEVKRYKRAVIMELEAIKGALKEFKEITKE